MSPGPPASVVLGQSHSSANGACHPEAAGLAAEDLRNLPAAYVPPA